jgi:hypothetical protein
LRLVLPVHFIEVSHINRFDGHLKDGSLYVERVDTASQRTLKGVTRKMLPMLACFIGESWYLSLILC